MAKSLGRLVVDLCPIEALAGSNQLPISTVARLDEAALRLERRHVAACELLRHLGKRRASRGKAFDQSLIDRLALSVRFAPILLLISGLPRPSAPRAEILR